VFGTGVAKASKSLMNERMNVEEEDEGYLYSALFVVPHIQGAQVWITQCNACLYLLSVHQMTPPQTEVADM